MSIYDIFDDGSDEEDLAREEMEHFKHLDGTENEDDDEGDEGEGNDDEDNLLLNPFRNCVQQPEVNSLLVAPKVDIGITEEVGEQLDSLKIDIDVTKKPESPELDIEVTKELDSPITNTDVPKLYDPQSVWNDAQMMLACRYRALGLGRTETTHLLVRALSNGGSSETTVNIPNIESQISLEVDRVYEDLPFIPQKTDSALADYCQEKLSDKVEFCADKMNFTYWNNDQWNFDKADHHVSMLVDRLILMIPQTLDDPNLKSDFERYVGSAGTTPSVVRILKRRVKQVSLSCFDANPYLLGVTNGVIDLNTFSFRAHESSDYLTKRANVIYDPNASCPLFEQYIEEILCHDRDLIRYVKTFLGYLLLGKNPKRLFFILLGNGRNGKSTLILMLQQILGNYANAMPRRTVLKSGYIGTGDDLMSMVGYRLLVTSELEDGDILAAGKLKSMTGNDNVSARNLYERYQNVCIDGKMVILSNAKPLVDDKSEGIWDRMVIIPFGKRLEEDEVDDELSNKLLEESAGILNWMLDGLKSYQQEGFKETSTMRALRNQYRLDNDPVRGFMDECYESSGEEFTKSVEVYRHFKRWYNAQYGEPSKLSQIKLNQQLAGMGFKFKRNPDSVFYVTPKG